MTSKTRTQKTYDHRLRDLVRSTGDIEHATRVGVPRSTARGWLTSTSADVVTVDVIDMNVVDLQQEVLALRKRVAPHVALLQLFVALLKMPGFSLDRSRLPDGSRKILLLRAIERSRAVLPLRVTLRVLRWTRARYQSWKREEDCGLDDVQFCPRS